VQVQVQVQGQVRGLVFDGALDALPEPTKTS
jgi:hypothetical protein